MSRDGNMAFVSARWDDIGSAIEQGLVYVFKWDGSEFTQIDKLVANDGGEFNWFGIWN